MNRKKYSQIIVRLSLVCLCVLTMSQTVSAQEKQGETFVSNDYRGGGREAIIVKWVANKLYYPGGFHVYRQENGSSTWEKITKTPLKVSKSVPAKDAAKDKDIKTLIDNLNKLSYQEFQDNLLKVFTAIKSVLSPRMAELLGTIYYDETAEKGKIYRYKVVGLINGKEEYINTTDQISVNPYQPASVPTGIDIKRKKILTSLGLFFNKSSKIQNFICDVR